MGLGGSVQSLNLCARGRPICENLARPCMSFVCVEILAENDHQINKLAHIALGGYFVPGSAFDPMLDQVSKLWLTERLTLSREKLPQMGAHPIFEFLNFRLGECRHLGRSNR